MDPLLSALANYQQADADGVMVLVSRQACDEAIREIERLRRERDDLVSFLAGLSRQADNMARSYEARN